MRTTTDTLKEAEGEAVLSKEQAETLLLAAGWQLHPCWVDPVRGTLVCQDVAVRRQQARRES